MASRELQRTEGLADRLRQVVESYGPITSLAREIGRSEGAIRKWLRGESEPQATDLRLLSRATDASVEWLLFGEVRFTAAFATKYLAYLEYQRECKSIKRVPAWASLTAAQRNAFAERAKGKLAAWASTEAAKAPD